MIKWKKALLLATSFLSFVLWYKLSSQKPSIVSNSMSVIFTPRPNNYFNMKYILQWTSPSTDPFNNMGFGQSIFFKQKCLINSCYVTPNRTLFGSTKKFDAILFHGPELGQSLIRIPRRYLDQKYVFVSRESSSNYPIRYTVYDDFFNWTWTYRLDSDIYYGYIIIRNKHYEVIGPKANMNWLKFEEMKPIDDLTIKKLKGKRKAACWIASHCVSNNNRFLVVNLLQIELTKYNLSIDVFGRCGYKHFHKKYMQQMLGYLQDRYYFFLAFENSMNEDYVTEKLLHALQHYTVPVVYGGANYTRFMPEGSYLVARKDNVKEIATQIFEAISNKQKYYDFFRWTNHYSYHYPKESPETDFYCDFCKKLHDVDLTIRKSSYKDFLHWWNLKQ